MWRKSAVLNFDTDKATDGKELPHDFWGNFRISLKASCFLKYASLTPNGRPYPRSECLNPYLAFSFWWLCKFNVASTLPHCSPGVTQQDNEQMTHTPGASCFSPVIGSYRQILSKVTCVIKEGMKTERMSVPRLWELLAKALYLTAGVASLNIIRESRQLSHKDRF